MLVTKSVRKFWSQDNREELFDIFDWTVLGLLGSALPGPFPTLLLFYVGFRYETEFIASLTLLALVGFCQGYLIIKAGRARRLFAIFGTTLAVVSILLNLALSYVGAISA